MSTTKGQRIGISIIAVVMVVGTVLGFFVMMLSTDNQVRDNEKRQKTLSEYQQKYAEYQQKTQKQADELSKKYYPEFKKYAKYPKKFNIDSVKKVKSKDLVKGSGKTIGDDTKYHAYYIGWNPDGKVFDQSIMGDKLRSPLDASIGLIEGWGEGVKGMKIGGIRLIEIPSDKAYGEKGSGKDIPPNTPIKFIVMAIESPEEIEAPELPNLGQ
ncbi:hypothetical protein CR956_01060 [Candidatus Saccharibacteria bacterium]|nr:MAG: hypothetical protein CR956_01060 [Candidatus Saccharibacteria bacterium]